MKFKSFPTKILPVMVVLFLLFGICCLSADMKKDEPVSRTGFYFDTVITITLYDGGSEEILDGCFTLAKTYENRFSKTIEGSDIWNINHADGQAVTVHEDTIELIRAALSYAEASGGRIDPSIGAVSALWDFSQEASAVIPSLEELQEALQHVDYHRITVTDTSVRLSDSKASLDLGFIAKGYIADRMKEYLVSRQVDSAIINLGGNVLTIGSKPDGTPFMIGVKQPFSSSGEPALALPVTDCSVVSSGSYERCFVKDGKLYHHILDTSTGYPVQTDLSSVTILSSSSMDGDALSTTCFILGYAKARSFIDSLENTEAVFILSDGSIQYSGGLQPPE